MNTKSFKTKTRKPCIQIGVPLFFILCILVIGTTGGVLTGILISISLTVITMGIWYLNPIIISIIDDRYIIKLSLFEKKLEFSNEDIRSIDCTNSRALLINLKSNKKIKISMRWFSEKDRYAIKEIFKDK